MRSTVDPFEERYDIRQDGHPITGQSERLMALPRLEMRDGKLYCNEADRLHVLALMLETCGIDAALRLGPLNLWQEAIADVTRL